MKTNSQSGTIWITNGDTNKKIKATDDIPVGYRRGRVNVISQELKEKLKLVDREKSVEKRRQTMMSRYGTMNAFLVSDKTKENYVKSYFEKEKATEKLPFNELTIARKRSRILKEQNYSCLSCGHNEWMDNPLILELDHIDGDTRNNERDNLRCLCPNCHSQTPTWKGRDKKTGIKKYPDEVYVEAIKVSSCMNQALTILGLKWGSHTTLKRMMNEYNIDFTGG